MSYGLGTGTHILEIKEYSMADNTFEIWIKESTFYMESPPERRHILKGVAFPSLKISAEKVCRDFDCWGMQIFKLKVKQKSALPIEENRKNLQMSIYFNLTQETIHPEFKGSSYDDISLEYNMPVASDIEIHFWKNRKKIITVLKYE